MVQFKPGDRVVFYNPEKTEAPIAATVVDPTILTYGDGDRIKVRYDSTLDIRKSLRGHTLNPILRYPTLERVFYSKLHKMLS